MKALLFLLFFAMLPSELWAKECKFSFGYRTNAREPLIKDAPDNNGLYFDLYQEAAKRLNCKLEVVRLPKKRVLAGMKKGEIDIYPSFNFSEKRSKFAYYFENGLPGGDVGLSRPDLADVKDLNKDLEGKVFLNFFGNRKWITNKKVQVKIVKETDLAKAIGHIEKKQADIFVYNKQSIEYYLKKEGKADQFKIHKDCCGGIMPLYLAFSRKSPNYKEVKNPNYDDKKPLSVENFPVMLDKSSLAYKLQTVLLEMKKDFTKKLYQKYYGGSAS